MGRAQVFQAAAAGLEPHVDMNPVLLKPSSDVGSQVIVLGRPVGDHDGPAYHAYQAEVWPIVTAALASGCAPPATWSSSRAPAARPRST
jgi:adenosylcobyric acid synthase